MKQFKLRAFDSKKYFTVKVYDNLKDLRIDADKTAGQDGLHKDTLGVCEPFVREVISSKGKVIKRRDEIGVIRLARKHLKTHIVFHETMHAAFWQYRLSLPKGLFERADFGSSCTPKEEKFIHLAGKIYIDMIRKMYKHKYWSND